VVFRILNRLIGRTDRSELGVDAVNAFVEGSASSDEINLIEQMMRENPALEKDLATQRTLLEVLDRVDTIEAPRSFAVTPEMVAAAERSESGLSRFAELFAPQRKLALAPAVIAGIAALSVALLTLGDITGVVDQDRFSGDDFVTSAASAVTEVQVAGDSSVSGDVIVTVVVEKEVVTESGRDASPEMATAVEEPLATVLVSEAQAPVVEPATEESALTAKSVAPESEPEASAGAISEEPPSLAAAPPALASGADGDEQTANDSAAVAPEMAEIDSADDLESGIAAITTLEYEAGEGADNSAVEGPTSEATAGAASDAGKGISLPLWQLQVALAALAVAAVGAWAGLRRVRGE
jgi:hypothetical protein